MDKPTLLQELSTFADRHPFISVFVVFVIGSVLFELVTIPKKLIRRRKDK